MRIDEKTTLQELWKLRRSFAPQWAEEAKKIRKARETLKGEALAQVEKAYEWFETVATCIIRTVNQAEEIQKLKAKLLEFESQKTAGDSLTDMERQRARQERAQKDWESKGAKDDTPDAPGRVKKDNLHQMDAVIDTNNLNRAVGFFTKMAKEATESFDAGNTANAEHAAKHIVEYKGLDGSFGLFESPHLQGNSDMLKLKSWYNFLSTSWKTDRTLTNESCRVILKTISLS